MKKALLLLLITVLFACNHTSTDRQAVVRSRTEKDGSSCRNSEYLAQAVLWFQFSPEMKALYYQCFNMAKTAIAYNIEHKAYAGKKNAVVVDLDETILNNSAYEGWLYLHDQVYTRSTWNRWVHEVSAPPLPGAVDFLKFAVENMDCDVFYVSNRNAHTQLEPTLENLRKYGLPCADVFHVLLKDTALAGGDSSKERRRIKIEMELNYEILLFIGDQLTDFSLTFDISPETTEEQITDSVYKYRELFSTRYFLLPNPMYGDWLWKLVVGQEKAECCSQLDSLRRKKIINWK